MIRALTAAVVDALGNVRSLIPKREPRREVTVEQVKDPEQLARLLKEITKDIAQLERRPCPRRADWEEVSFNGDGITLYPFAHGFGGRVRWWPVETKGAAGLVEDSTTSADVLVLRSNLSGTVTIRVEEVGG